MISGIYWLSQIQLLRPTGCKEYVMKLVPVKNTLFLLLLSFLLRFFKLLEIDFAHQLFGDLEKKFFWNGKPKKSWGNFLLRKRFILPFRKLRNDCEFTAGSIAFAIFVNTFVFRLWIFGWLRKILLFCPVYVRLKLLLFFFSI